MKNLYLGSLTTFAGRVVLQASPLRTTGQFRLVALLLWGSISLFMPRANAQTSPASFAYTGAAQTFTVPTGITTLTIVANGAQGGGTVGGRGGRVTATLAVTPGQILTILVGGAGTAPTGGFNGGANGIYGGGGATDIRLGGTGGLADRILVAGGGGGASGNPGGAGGNETGGDGVGYFSGHGGTQNAGGAAGSTNGSNAVAGTTGAGGNGGSSANGLVYEGGGGGGGYFGGGGGISGPYSGGGGSSYTDPSLASSVVLTQGANTGNGSLTLSWVTPCASLPDVTIVFPSSATVSPGPVITVPVGQGLNYQVLGGGPNSRYDRRIIMDRINGFEIRTVLENSTGLFPIDRAGPYQITVTDGNGCSRTVTGEIRGK